MLCEPLNTSSFDHFSLITVLQAVSYMVFTWHHLNFVFHGQFVYIYGLHLWNFHLFFSIPYALLGLLFWRHLRDTFLGTMDSALCDFWYVAPYKNMYLLTYLLTYSFTGQTLSCRCCIASRWCIFMTGFSWWEAWSQLKLGLTKTIINNAW